VQLLIQIAAWCYGQGPNKLLELNGAILRIRRDTDKIYNRTSPCHRTHIILIEDTEDQGGKFAGVSVGEELLIDFDEALRGERARGHEKQTERGDGRGESG